MWQRNECEGNSALSYVTKSAEVAYPFFERLQFAQSQRIRTTYNGNNVDSM